MLKIGLFSLATLLLSLISQPAEAAPIIPIFGAIGVGAAATFGISLVATSFVAIAIGAVIVGGVLYFASRALKAKKAASRQGPQGTLVSRSGSAERIPLIYGKRRLAGIRTFIANNGEENADLYVVETICEGPIKGCSKIFFNDELAATSTDDGATWTAESKYDGYLTITFYDGSQTTADGTLSGIDGWSSTDVGNKVAYAILKLTWNQDTYGGGVPNVTYLVEGKLVPAIGSSQSSTLSYSNNPAEVVYDYLTNTLYGKAIPYTLIDTTSFNTIKNYCNETVDKTSTDSTQVTRYECNAYIDTDDTLLNNMQQLFSSFRGSLITGDKYKLIADKPKTWSGVTIDDDNIIGNIEFVQASKRSLLNHIKASIANEVDDFNYQEDIITVEDATLQSSSVDGLKLSDDLELSATTNVEMAERIITEELNSARQSGTVSVDVSTELIRLEVGDVVKFSNSTLGQTDKLYSVIQTTLKPDNNLQLLLKEYDANTFWDNNKTIIQNNKDDTDH